MKTVLFGINTATDILYEQVNSCVIATSDGSGEFKGLDVLDLNDVLQLHQQGLVKHIIICSMYVSEISNSLSNIGVKKDMISYYDFSFAEVKPISSVSHNVFASDETLYAFYDLSCNLATFDCTMFAILAELERIKRKKKYIQFFIVPDISEAENYTGYSQYHDVHDLHWRINHVIEPVFSLIKSCASVTRLACREQAEQLLSGKDETSLFPAVFKANNNNYAVRQNMFLDYSDEFDSFSFLQPHQQAVKQIDQYFDEVVGGRKAIVIVLREYEQQKHRNSSLEQWGQFLDSLDGREFFPIIVRDTYQSARVFPSKSRLAKYACFPLASIDIHFRAALYARSYMCLAKTNGAFYMTNFIKGCRTITFIEVDDSNPTMSTGNWLKSGYVPGEDSFLRDNNFQRLVWDTDSIHNITTAFWRLYKDIEAGVC